MVSFLQSKNYKKIFLLLLIVSISPLLFSKINLIGNHEIPNYLTNFFNFKDFLINHEEINFMISSENQRYRPTFYIIKGLEYFLLEDNHFNYFALKFLLIILSAYFIYEANKIVFKKEDLIFFSTSAIIFFPTNYDIFARLDVQEFYFLIFFSILTFLIIKKNLFKNLEYKLNDFFVFILLILISGVKEIFVFHICLFIIVNYLFNLKITIFKNKFYYFFLILLQLLFLTKFLSIFVNVGSGAYELEHNFNKLFFLIKTFPFQNPINFALIFGWIFCIFLNYQIRISFYDFKLLLLLSSHIILDYFFYQGLGSYRHYLIGLICLVYFFSIIYKKYFFEISLFKKKAYMIKNLLFFIILFFFIMLLSLNLKMTFQNIKEYKILSKIYNSDQDLIIKSQIPHERFISLVYFSNFYKPQKQIIYSDGKKSFLISPENLTFRFSMPKNHYTISQNEFDCLIFDEGLDLEECKVLYFFPKEINLF